MFFDIPVRVGRANLESPVYKSIDDMFVAPLTVKSQSIWSQITQPRTWMLAERTAIKGTQPMTDSVDEARHTHSIHFNPYPCPLRLRLL